MKRLNRPAACSSCSRRLHRPRPPRPAARRPSAPSRPGRAHRARPGEQTGAARAHLTLPAGNQPLTVDGRERAYLMYRPATAGQDAPLVVVLHGAAGSGRQAQESYGWDAAADKGGFVVAYPDGVNRTWNAGPGCCGAAARDKVDDVAFITRLVDEIPSVDKKRVYATGISNGAMLAYRLACETGIFAAIGPVAGTMISDCPAPKPLSIIHIHGESDPTIPYAAGRVAAATTAPAGSRRRSTGRRSPP